MVQVCGFLVGWILLGWLGFKCIEGGISRLIDAKINGIENKYLWMLAIVIVALVVCPIMGCLFTIEVLLALILILSVIIFDGLKWFYGKFTNLTRKPQTSC